MEKQSTLLDEAAIHDTIAAVQAALQKIRNEIMKEEFEDLLPFERRLAFIEENILAAYLEIMLMHLLLIQNI